MRPGIVRKDRAAELRPRFIHPCSHEQERDGADETLCGGQLPCPYRGRCHPGVFLHTLHTAGKGGLPHNRTQEKEDYRITGIYNYDVIRFWYCVALLAQSPDECAVACLSGLARTLMEQGPGELGILYRILLLLPEREHLHGLTDELANYYRKIIPDLEAAKWLAEAGIPYPDTFEWSVSFRFTSNGETVLLSGNETERKAWFTLSVELFGPQALYGDYTRFTSYHIHVRNGDNSVHGHWNEKDGYLA